MNTSTSPLESEAEAVQSPSSHKSSDMESPQHWLLVIEPHQARIFHSAWHGTSPLLILSPTAEWQLPPTIQSRDFTHRAEQPKSNAFFTTVAHVLKGADDILMIGTDEGRSNSIEHFITWIQNYRQELFGRIKGSLVKEVRDLTEAELLTEAREFFTRNQAA